MTQKDQVGALFWCSLLRPLIEGETEPEDALRRLRKIAAQEHLFPDGRRRKVSVTTLRRKWQTFQKDGFEALARKPRSDRGQSRKHQPEWIERSVELRRRNSRRVRTRRSTSSFKPSSAIGYLLPLLPPPRRAS